VIFNTFSTPFHQYIYVPRELCQSQLFGVCSQSLKKSAFAKLFSYTPNIFISKCHTLTHISVQLTEPLPLLIFGDAFERLGTSSQLLR
jgi:hypothetical protein